MPTIKQLKRGIEKEKNFAENKKDIEEIGSEKKKLKKELFQLRFKRQNPNVVKVSKALAMGGKAVGKGLLNLSDNLERSARLQQQMRKKKLQKQVSNIRKVKPKRRKINKPTVKDPFKEVGDFFSF